MARKIDLTELSEYTGLSRHALRIMIKSGDISYIRVGYGKGKLYFDPEVVNKELDMLAAENKKETKELAEQFRKTQEVLYSSRFAG